MGVFYSYRVDFSYPISLYVRKNYYRSFGGGAPINILGKGEAAFPFLYISFGNTIISFSMTLTLTLKKDKEKILKEKRKKIFTPFLKEFFRVFVRISVRPDGRSAIMPHILPPKKISKSAKVYRFVPF